MPRKRDEGLVAQAVGLAASGKTRAEIAVALSVSERTVSNWLRRPTGRPRLPEGQGSRWTLRRRERETEDRGRTE